VNLAVENALISLALVFCRVGGCFLTVPGLSSARVPAQVRILLVLALVIALAPLVWPYVGSHGKFNAAELARNIFTETVTGGFVGLTVRFLMLALGFGASAIAMSIGFGGLQGPGIEEVDLQSSMVTFITMSALTLLFVMDFHHDVIKALMGSYRVLPVGEGIDPERLLSNLLDTLTDCFLIILRLSSPFIIYSLVANLAIGLLNKLSPQLPIYFISLPFVLAGGILLAYFAIPNLMILFVQAFLELRLVRQS
jgi:flagellar biosynthesis protein FliR